MEELSLQRKIFAFSHSFAVNVAPNIDWWHEVTCHEGGECVNKTTRLILEVEEEMRYRYGAITARNTGTVKDSTSVSTGYISQVNILNLSPASVTRQAWLKKYSQPFGLLFGNIILLEYPRSDAYILWIRPDRWHRTSTHGWIRSICAFPFTVANVNGNPSLKPYQEMINEGSNESNSLILNGRIHVWIHGFKLV